MSASITAVKNLRTFVAAATSNGAGSTTTGTSFDLTTKFGGTATMKITNGGTGPTIGCTAKVMVSGDNTNFKLYRAFLAGLTASGVYEFSCDIPASVMYARVDFTGNTGQAVTVEAFLQELTSIASL